LQQNSVADFSMKNGRENRTNGNQEKGKEEKEALRSQHEVKGGRQKRPLSFCAEVTPAKSIQRRSSFLRSLGSNIGSPFFASWTQATKSTKRAVEIWFRFEVPFRNASRHRLHALARFFQLKLGSLRNDREVPFQIVEHQLSHAVSPLLACGHGINRELQALIGVLLRASLAGLVVDDDNASVGLAVHAIDSSCHFGSGDLNVKPFFRM
jgi:hypothetical protein